MKTQNQALRTQRLCMHIQTFNDKKPRPLRVLYQQTGGKSHITKTQSCFYLHLLRRELEEYVERRSFIC